MKDQVTLTQVRDYISGKGVELVGTFSPGRKSYRTVEGEEYGVEMVEDDRICTGHEFMSWLIWGIPVPLFSSGNCSRKDRTIEVASIQPLEKVAEAFAKETVHVDFNLFRGEVYYAQEKVEEEMRKIYPQLIVT